MIIAIDGPAGSGKSTIAKKLAQKLSSSYLDTGAMYRGVTLAAIEAKADFSQPEQLVKIAQNTILSFINKNGTNALLINGKDRLDNGQDVNHAIRSQQVTDASKPIASNPKIREILVKQQQVLGRNLKSLVTEGRDQTTVVFPNADFKFYLDANPEIRAKRRYEQMQQKGIEADYNEILESQTLRDHADANRDTGALRIAPDAIIVDTSNMSIQEVIDFLHEIINKNREM